jgi:hypothetical protein
MPMVDVDKIWKEVQANQAKLNACKRHVFNPVPHPRHKLIYDYVCAECGGKIDAIHHHWYERGFKDGAQTHADPSQTG